VLKTKMFLSTLLTQRKPGSAPGQWTDLEAGDPIDRQINDWVDRTGNVLVSVPAPSFHVQWLDKAMTTQSVLTAVMIVYEVKEDTRERTADWPERTDAAAPAGADADPAPGVGPNAAAGSSSTIRGEGP
jgi:hypothetical protein